ncbi:Asr1405/Asl0597 family protein [Altericista sp. CCNU0014]|uniref:Asr1405/Asl0597 family protein n=1 Tax=Altericista sp. CCNU0014 TaxID=3082949 RepID=UPI00384B1B88
MIPTPLTKPFHRESSADQIVAIAQPDRWQVCYRLRELQIPCTCPADGTLRVAVDHAIALLLVRSTIQQFTASRRDLLDWLERCWQSDGLA